MSGCPDEKSVRALRTGRLRGWFESACQARDIVRGGDAADLRACTVSTGISIQTLRRWAFAADRFTTHDIAALADWHDASGHTLNIWHVIELARLPRIARDEVLISMRDAVWPLVKLRAFTRSRKCRRGTESPISGIER